MYDAVIIGAGMSGLAAGIRLAMYDQRVCILERHYAVGGLNSYYRLDGRNYDVGLHALTNFAPRGAKHGPLPRLLRQLRLSWDDFELAEQNGSLISFPETQLRFNNDPGLLATEIQRAFPNERDGYQRLLGKLLNYDEVQSPQAADSARAILASTIGDPLLVEMLLCPVMFYGSAREHDIDWRDIESVGLRVHADAIAVTGLREPENGLSAQVSVYHWAAAALIRRNAGLEEATDAAARDPDIRGLRGKITAERDAAFGRDGAGADVTMKDGRRLTSNIAHCRGSAARPMTDAELEGKMRLQARGLLTDAAIDDLIALCWNIERVDDVGKRVQALFPVQ